MSKPRLCMIFEATGRYNAIGKIAMAQVEAALEAGWRVSVVAHRLDEELQGRVEWLNLYNPSLGFAIKWLTARNFIKKAMGDPSRFDVVHGHQPQIADFCDIFECHYLTRAAMERGCRDARPGPRGVLARLQESVVLRAEDRCYQRWNQQTELICDSELTLHEFDRLYGLPERNSVQIYPAPRWAPPTLEQRVAARREWIGDWRGPVVGFLGGMHQRKGFREALAGVAESPEVFLLLAGAHGEKIQPPAKLKHRYRGFGLIETSRFYEAIDVLLVPSVFEPFGLVCFEAVAKGVPVITTESVGALQELENAGCGKPWVPGQPLAPLVEQLISNPAETKAACQRLVEANSAEQYRRRVIDRYEQALKSKAGI